MDLTSLFHATQGVSDSITTVCRVPVKVSAQPGPRPLMDEMLGSELVKLAACVSSCHQHLGNEVTAWLSNWDAATVDAATARVGAMSSMAAVEATVENAGHHPAARGTGWPETCAGRVQ